MCVLVLDYIALFCVVIAVYLCVYLGRSECMSVKRFCPLCVYVFAIVFVCASQCVCLFVHLFVPA